MTKAVMAKKLTYKYTKCQYNAEMKIDYKMYKKCIKKCIRNHIKG